MSESIVRKVQPFTIGTKLSAPAVPKCPDFTESFLPSQALDNCKLRRNLNDRVSLYLGRAQVRASAPCLAPKPPRESPAQRQQEEMAEEDHLNRNAASPTAASRSIRKIAISSSTEDTRDRATPKPERPKVKARPNSENNNNNNNITTSSPPLPRIVGVSCENKPSSHFKVLLRKDSNDEKQSNHVGGASGLLLNRGKSPSIHQTPVLKALSPKRDLLKGDSPPCEHKEVPSGSKVTAAQNDLCFTQRNALFNREVSQAEAWIKGKLQDLKDGCNVQRCPLKDWEEVSQTLQRDLKDFENTLMQLNQMGEQLTCKLNPTADLVKKQLSQLRDQWHALKQTAANQSKALGGARNLQEFNKKVDRLEAWIKEKEEEQALANLLGENIDKMQLTRRILDLKQDEQLYRNLHEEINHLALRLEKQGKTEGKNISTRRKHINKMWLKVQSLLKDYHENLQLALEVSSFYQQADNIVCSINSMRKSFSVTHGQENSGDGEIRDIASQIMMLDVTVSQLSNLHPALAARVTQKQGEVKDRWALLQKDVRSDRSAPPPPGSPFAREDADPATLSREPQCSVGIEPHRIMGKEVKEEQNRLKGCVGGGDLGDARRTTGGRDEAWPAAGESAARACTSDVTARRQAAGESRKQKAEPQPGAAPQGHPQLHTQLQKFTVSADKTLAWLKENVATATQICCTVGSSGLEAAKRHQAALEQDILSNRARIEVVKKEGRSLVRAQHPGSAKIQEFLGQLEVLWEELKKRHQRNVVVLQTSEELNYRAVRVLQALGSLEAWLEAVELSIRQSSLAGDPESMSAAERESCLLGREVSARGLELRTLRQEVDTLRSQSHLHTELLPTRMDQVEKKYQSVQSALTQQSAELQDTRMLTEFLERVELEESHYSTLGQPLRSEIDSEPSLLALRGGGSGEPLMESIGDPVETLREAVEMLNDTARERGRSLTHDQSVQELLNRHSTLSVQLEQRLKLSAELAADVLECESEMAVRCEPERSGLEGLQEQQGQLEIGYAVLKDEVDAVQSLAARLADLCPERVHVLGAELQATLQAWEELGKSVAENQGRLRQFGQLRDFFRNYLAMISWTEDTRSCIFSESALHHGREDQEPLAAVLDLHIEQKFDEFDELTAAGKKLSDEEHHLTKMIKERMEELRSMLGWILVHWRAQKEQWQNRKPPEPQADAIYSEATVRSPPLQSVLPQPESQRPATGPVPEDTLRPVDTPATAHPGGLEDRQGEQQQLESGYEVMSCVSPRGGDVTHATETPSASPFLVLKEPSVPSLGGTVNLILSFGTSGDSQLQVQEPAGDEGTEVPEAVHRVSTYLHVKDSAAASPVYECITLPRLSPASSSSCASSSPSSSPSSSSDDSPPQVGSTSFHALLTSGATASVFSSLRRRSKKRKQKRDARRHTVQRIMGVEEPPEGAAPSPPAAYDTHTWPLKERRRRRSAGQRGPAGVQDYVKNPLARDIDAECSGGLSSAGVQDYVKNPLARDIDAECSGGLSSAAPPGPEEDPAAPAPTGHARNHCRFLSLGSVLSFELPKDMSLVPSIQDVITIGPSEPRRADPQARGPYAERPSALSTFRLARSPPTCRDQEAKHSPHGEMTLKIGRHGTQDIHAFPPPPPPATQGISFEESHAASLGDLAEIQLKRLSGISGLHEQAGLEWDKMAAELARSGPKPADSRMSLSLAEGEGRSAPAAHGHGSAAREAIHVCPSVHTLIQDLNGHQYHRASKPPATQAARGSPAAAAQGHAPHTALSVKASGRASASGREDSVDSGHSSSGSFKLGAEAPCLEGADCPPPRRAAGRALSPETAGCGTRDSAGPEPRSAAHDPVHPDHQQFEEVEGELEDIWNQTNGYRQSVCSDIMYRGAELATTPPGQPREQAVLYRKLVTASAPNLLVAEFRLPPSVQTLLGYGRGSSPREEARALGKGERQSWAAFPRQEQACRQVVLVNETATDPVKLPDIEDRQKYIYQYREEEEEEEDQEEDTGCPKDQSMSLLSVHMGLDGTEEQGHRTTTGGHCSTMNGSPEFPSMEGTLERKHKLQLGGKKAQCRAWNTYHAVLYRQTLCFYQDRKDTLRSSVSSLPLNLTGAECAPAPEYSKKANCFSLRLRDGSEYLLSVSSRFMMRKWMLKIQANTGSSEPVISKAMLCGPSVQDFCLAASSSPNTACHCRAKCHCSSRDDVTSSLSGCSYTGTARTKEIVVLTRDSTQIPLWHHGKLEDLSPTSSSDAGHCEDDFNCPRQATRQRIQAQSPRGLCSPSPLSSLSHGQDWQSGSKRRSHSFTSATYQRIKPAMPPPASGCQDSNSSYSVTLFIGDKPSGGQRMDPPQPTGSRQEPFPDLPLRSYASLPRPRNKSVFKKFFGKKE